jgi:16S rRNA (cytosine1402-N4)-methyltransferase
MEFIHKPVLADEVIEKLNIKPDGVYVDGTLGGAGHSQLICDRLSTEGTLIGIDRDDEALAVSKERLAEAGCRKFLVKSDYSDLKLVLRDLGIEKIDGALLDIGVSSYQLDNAERGFSYMNDAPLDMRMDREAPLTARDVVNTYSEDELKRIIREYGEERWASRIASFIVRERAKQPIETTGELVEIIKEAIPAKARRGGHHPAKRTFQAIRIEVNDELGQLEQAVRDYSSVLAPGGRLCIITFHSLEDRIVKKGFRDLTEAPQDDIMRGMPQAQENEPDFRRVTRKPITASEEELADNPRSRSAKLRVIERVR